MPPEQAQQFRDDVLNIVSQLACHRVVNKEGRLAPGWSRQHPLLESEGVQFRPNGYVEMKNHLWEPECEL